MKKKLPLVLEVFLGVAVLGGLGILIFAIAHQRIRSSFAGGEHLQTVACVDGRVCEYRDSEHRVTCWWSAGGIFCMRDER